MPEFPSAVRRLAWWAVVLAGVLATVLLPLTFPPGGGPTGLDRVIADAVHAGPGGHPWMLRAAVIPSDAYVVLPVLLIGVLGYAARGDRFAAVFLLVVPESVVAVNAWVLKPLWHRHLHDYLGYPSGHTVQLVAVVTGFVLVARDRRIQVGECVIAVPMVATVAVGMVGLGYHYPTDVLGGAAAAVALVTAAYAGANEVRARRAAAQNGP